MAGPTLQGRTEPHIEVGEAGVCGDGGKDGCFSESLGLTHAFYSSCQEAARREVGCV